MTEIRVDYKQLFAIANDETLIQLMKHNESFASSVEFEEIVKRRNDLNNKARILDLFKKIEINETDWEPCMYEKRIYIRYAQRYKSSIIVRLYDIYVVSAYMLEKGTTGCNQSDLYTLAINNLPPLRLVFNTMASYKKHIDTTVIPSDIAQRFVASPNDFDVTDNANKITADDFGNDLLAMRCPSLCTYNQTRFQLEYARDDNRRYAEILNRYINGEYTCTKSTYCTVASKGVKLDMIYMKPLGDGRFKLCETYVRNGELYYKEPNELPQASLNLHLECMILEKL